MEKLLMNRLTYLLELTEKKKVDSIESKILLDDMLLNIRDYLFDAKVDKFEDKSKDIKRVVIKYDQQFFKDNLPLQKVLYCRKNEEPYKVNPFKIIEFKSNIDSSIVNPQKIEKGKHRGEIGFTDILIKDKITKLSYANIAHELVHTQIEKNPKSLTNFYNREVLSIFVEMIISKSLCERIVNNYMRYRFQNVCVCLNGLSRYEEYYYTYDDICKFRCYLSSSLKALHLYDIYNNSNKYKKIEILSLVEDVFRNKITVEDFLDKMHVTYNNSKDVELVKEYIKK